VPGHICWRTTHCSRPRAPTISALPEIAELNIGYFMIGEAIFVGLAETVREMRAAMDRGRGKATSKATSRVQSKP
jgi:hypothetical protein